MLITKIVSIFLIDKLNILMYNICIEDIMYLSKLAIKNIKKGLNLRVRSGCFFDD